MASPKTRFWLDPGTKARKPIPARIPIASHTDHITTTCLARCDSMSKRAEDALSVVWDTRVNTGFAARRHPYECSVPVGANRRACPEQRRRVFTCRARLQRHALPVFAQNAEDPCEEFGPVGRAAASGSAPALKCPIKSQPKTLSCDLILRPNLTTMGKSIKPQPD